MYRHFAYNCSFNYFTIDVEWSGMNFMNSIKAIYKWYYISLIHLVLDLWYASLSRMQTTGKRKKRLDIPTDILWNIINWNMSRCVFLSFMSSSRNEVCCGIDHMRIPFCIWTNAIYSIYSVRISAGILRGDNVSEDKYAKIFLTDCDTRVCPTWWD